MSIFRLFVIQEKHKKHYPHCIIELLLLGAYFEKKCDRLKLKITLTKKRLKFKPKNFYRVIWI